MTYQFDPDQGLIVIRAKLFGPNGSAILRLALDTGATGTLIVGPLVALGYDPAGAPERTQLTTGSGVVVASRLPIMRIVALGRYRIRFPVIAHTLPPSAGVDGLLGLDFFRGRSLSIDFASGLIELG